MNFYRRFKTKEIHIGHLPLGGANPIRIQSMTNTHTLDTDATVKQTLELIESGCDYVRITAPGMKEAENLIIIKKKIKESGFNTPIIADVHFSPKIAEFCARYVEKVRINPGNYADKKSFKKNEYTDVDYFAELDRIAKGVKPLIDICKEYGTVIRIGTNHGSLSDRIINRYGDTPMGMVESTMEFLRICKDFNFLNIVVSLKASNPIIMMQANRLLVQQMIKESLCLPLHLGVTEAGEGEDGRIRSALGIGTLLSEGIGDTIRVSLTENPVNEIPFAKLLAEDINKKKKISFYDTFASDNFTLKTHTYSIRPHPCVILKFNSHSDTLLKKVFSYNKQKSQLERQPTSPDGVYFTQKTQKINFNNDIETFYLEEKNNITFIRIDEANDIDFSKVKAIVIDTDSAVDLIKKIDDFKTELLKKQPTALIYLTLKYKGKDFERWLANSTVLYGSLLIRKLIDGFYVDVKTSQTIRVLNALFGIMQACRVRISKTEYISCPTCGRTSFDMEPTLRRIKDATEHLKGLKMGVMGCIVNGPGEMADADYGYVGNANGKVNLYKGNVAVKKNISKEKALEELINILKQDGKWKEKY